ncbi:MAG: LysR family transcriptional regulator [Proteobacteria bacterium]|nr:LysR family transcriptional regulator [Pseudomonadota bacterium]
MSAYERLPLNALRVFEAVATRLSFGEAAEALHVTPAAVSQQIKTLEDYLQTPLFRRDGRKVQLTAEGARLLPGIRQGLDQLEATLQHLRQDRQSGNINMSTLASFLARWLSPRLGEFRSLHPDIELRIHTSPEAVDFARTDFHAAVRFGLGGYGDLHTEKILGDWLVVVATPEVIDKYGMLPNRGDLSQYPLIHGDELDWTNWSTGDTRSMRALRGAFIDEPISMLTACMAGMGYALSRWTIAYSDLKAGRLAIASEHILPHQFTYYFVCPKDYATFPKVAALRDWLLVQGREFEQPPLAGTGAGPKRAAKAATAKAASAKRKP